MKAVALAMILALIPTFAGAQPDTSTSTSPETTDIHIRRLAGLSAASAEGDLEILDVGHLPLSTMLSIVARKTAEGWHVSYACAASPDCSPKADHLALDYDLDSTAALQLSTLLKKLKSGGDPEGTKRNIISSCGNLTIAINYEGFKRVYSRSCSWGHTLGALETLLKPPGSGG